MIKILSLIGVCALFATAHAQADTDIVNIPDANFKRYLRQNTRINTNRDSEITYGEARAYTGDIDVPNKNIATLEGIGAFRNIKKLYCAYNQLTSIDISQNTQLETLDCRNNQLTNISISQNQNLRSLSINNNGITSINISQNPLLEIFQCGGNPITSLNLSANIGLKKLNCNNTQISTLDISQNRQLDYLNCDNNGLTTLNISQNTELQTLECRGNRLTDLDITQNTKLEYLYCEANQIKHLNASNNPNLSVFRCDNNKLTYLNLANGNNTALLGMSAKGNPELSCIQIDRNFTPPPMQGIAGWDKDPHAAYNVYCSPPLSTHETSANETLTVANPMGETIIIAEQKDILKIEIYNTAGQWMKTLMGSDRNISELSKGIYFLRIYTPKGSQHIKAIKQ